MDLRVSDMLEMQKKLRAHYLDKWGALTPERGAEQLLWGIGEIGEVIEIIKKRGDKDIMESPETRSHFIEELADVEMYLLDVMLCYGITPEEYSRVHADKFEYNLRRDYAKQCAEMFDKK